MSGTAILPSSDQVTEPTPRSRHPWLHTDWVRAAIVSRALERERRRQVAERDATILAGHAPDAEMDQLAGFAATTPMPDLD